MGSTRVRVSVEGNLLAVDHETLQAVVLCDDVSRSDVITTGRDKHSMKSHSNTGKRIQDIQTNVEVSVTLCFQVPDEGFLPKVISFLQQVDDLRFLVDLGALGHLHLHSRNNLLTTRGSIHTCNT